MYVEVDLESGRVGLAERDNFKQFHVVPKGAGSDDDVADALGTGGRRCSEPDHVYVAVDLVRQLAEPRDEAWDAGFDKMLGFAQKMGWLDESGAFIQAHTERVS